MTPPNLSLFLLIGHVHALYQPFWGCGLLGDFGNFINPNGTTTPAMATLVEGLKVTNKHDGKVSYWNWEYVPIQNDVTTSGKMQILTKDFVFMPEEWGIGVVQDDKLRPANVTNFLDGSGKTSAAQMADIVLTANEPDIYGSCMGDMMGKCLGPCTQDEADRGDCPVCRLDGPEASRDANSAGHCNCNSESKATGVGFWPVDGITSAYQPLPTCFDHEDCKTYILEKFRESTKVAVNKGYKYITAPLVAVNMTWMKLFVRSACEDCKDISCGCPTHVGWHFYANDCQPEHGGYQAFQKKLDDTVELMEEFPHLLGAIVNEVGMLNCAMDTPDAICIPNGPNQKYPARSQTDNACPSTAALPKGLGSFIDDLLQMVAKAKTNDGRHAVVSLTWFNLNQAGGTYNLEMFKADGSLNSLGESYITSCQMWADGQLNVEAKRNDTTSPSPWLVAGPIVAVSLVFVIGAYIYSRRSLSQSLQRSARMPLNEGVPEAELAEK